MITTDRRNQLRTSVRFLYDLQKLRIQQGNRTGSDTVVLEGADLEFHRKRSESLNMLEKAELKNVENLCKDEPINKWLRAQKGIGATMVGCILSEFDITKAETISAFWKYCGLHVLTGGWTLVHSYKNRSKRKTRFERFTSIDLENMETIEHEEGYNLKFDDGTERYWLSMDVTEDESDIKVEEFRRSRAPHPIKGQKLGYNAWLRTKLVGVAADCMIKANSPWRQFYDEYKLRKQSMVLPVCMGCDGTKRAKKGENKGQKCKNCKGTGKDAPWGESDGHRHRAAIRYMMKKFLQELWITWRKLEGLSVTESYAEAVLGRHHGDHGGTNLHP